MSPIERLSDTFKADFGLEPLMASELEFYLYGADKKSEMQAFCDALFAKLTKEGLAPHSIDKERGKEQYEVAILPSLPITCARRTANLKPIITEFAASYGLRADFAAKPLANEPGSGLHIHIDLLDSDKHTVFFKQDDAISDALKHSIGGLLAWMLPCMPIFAPNPESYARFVANNNAPLTVSWGANNRTVALRLPDAEGGHRHIEHRVAGSDANPYHVVAVILAAIHDGLASKYTIPEQIYGDAALDQYDLPRFPTNLEDALKQQEISTLHNVIQDMCN